MDLGFLLRKCIGDISSGEPTVNLLETHSNTWYIRTVTGMRKSPLNAVKVNLPQGSALCSLSLLAVHSFYFLHLYEWVFWAQRKQAEARMRMWGNLPAFLEAIFQAKFEKKNFVSKICIIKAATKTSPSPIFQTGDTAAEAGSPTNYSGFNFHWSFSSRHRYSKISQQLCNILYLMRSVGNFNRKISFHHSRSAKDETIATLSNRRK